MKRIIIAIIAALILAMSLVGCGTPRWAGEKGTPGMHHVYDPHRAWIGH